MQLTFEKDDLLKAVQVLQSVAGSRNTLPILSNILVNAQNERIEMSATDLEVGIRIQVNGTIVEPGSITIPARKISEIIRELPPSVVKLVTTANDRVEIECERGVYTMIGLSSDEFPLIMSMPDEFFTVDAETFKTMIAKTAFAASTEETRYYLNGVFLHLFPSESRIVATDGRRLALVKSPAVESITEEIGVIVPIKAVGEIRKTFTEAKELKISISENQIIFSDGISTLTSRLVEGEFPDYDRIIPKDNDINIYLDTQQFLAVVRRVSLLANPKTLLIKLETQDGIMKVSATNPDFGEAHEEMEIKSGDGNIVIAFSAKFTIDVLTHIDSEEVLLNLKDPLSAALLKPANDENYLYLIMPMRLD
ncbi:DNA polymerase III subunit beta [Candidatus Poribacteria bacterium]|nr:DNA polymerase III subunit beta [Candidatus Poribacteria bacterium]